MGRHQNPPHQPSPLRSRGRCRSDPQRNARPAHGHGWRRLRDAKRRRHRFRPHVPPFPPAKVDRILRDGDTVQLGGTTLTAHKTAGHTEGCTTWTLQTHEGTRTLNVVIVGGWAPNPAVRLIATPDKPASYPNIAADFDRTFKTLAALPCDIFLDAHGGYFDMLPKLTKAVWIDSKGYQQAVSQHEATYRKLKAAQH